MIIHHALTADQMAAIPAVAQRFSALECERDALKSRVRELEAALREIAKEQSAASATEAADRFQSIARDALAKTEKATG